MKIDLLALLVALAAAVDSVDAVASVVDSAVVEALEAVEDSVVALEAVEAMVVAVASAAVLPGALPLTPTLLLPRPTHSQTTLLQAESPATPSTFATYPGRLATRTLSSSSLPLARLSALRSNTSPMVALAELVLSSLRRQQMLRPLLVSLPISFDSHH